MMMVVGEGGGREGECSGLAAGTAASLLPVRAGGGDGSGLRQGQWDKRRTRECKKKTLTTSERPKQKNDGRFNQQFTLAFHTPRRQPGHVREVILTINRSGRWC